MPRNIPVENITPFRYVFRSLWYRRRGFISAAVALTLLLTYLTLLSGAVGGVDREVTTLYDEGRAPPEDLLDLRDTLGGWYTVTFVLYSLYIFFLSTAYFFMVAVSRREEAHLLKNLGFGRWEVDMLFLLESLYLTTLTAIISLLFGLVMTPHFPRIFSPYGLEFRGIFQPLDFLLLTLILVATGALGAIFGGEISQRERMVRL